MAPRHCFSSVRVKQSSILGKESSGTNELMTSRILKPKVSEEPYTNGHEKVRKSFARADHADDVIYISGVPFDPELKLPHGRPVFENYIRFSHQTTHSYSFQIILFSFMG